MTTDQLEQLARLEASRNNYEHSIAQEEAKLAINLRRLTSLTSRRTIVQLQIEMLEGRKVIMVEELARTLQAEVQLAGEAAC